MKIIRKTKGFEPPVDTLLNYFDFEDKKLMESNPRANKNGAIIFTPSALEELDRHIMWGQRNYRNLVEVIGYLVGTVILVGIQGNEVVDFPMTMKELRNYSGIEFK